jgi:hypothetical protein
MGTDDQQSPPSSAQRRETAYGQRAAFRSAKRESLLVRTVPVSGDLPRYRIPSARRDLVAGLTVTVLSDFEVASLTEEIGPEHFYPSVRLASRPSGVGRAACHLTRSTRATKHPASVLRTLT